ncbi:MAG: hypothetical protein WAT81_04730 [Candidatus Moraniibacteriota bacterium]
MGKRKDDMSPLGLTTVEITAALKRYKVLCEHHSSEPSCSFYEWEEQALKRIIDQIKDTDPDAVALLCYMVQYCIEKDRAAIFG